MAYTDLQDMGPKEQAFNNSDNIAIPQATDLVNQSSNVLKIGTMNEHVDGYSGGMYQSEATKEQARRLHALEKEQKGTFAKDAFRMEGQASIGCNGVVVNRVLDPFLEKVDTNKEMEDLVSKNGQDHISVDLGNQLKEKDCSLQTNHNEDNRASLSEKREDNNPKISDNDSVVIIDDNDNETEENDSSCGNGEHVYFTDSNSSVGSMEECSEEGSNWQDLGAELSTSSSCNAGDDNGYDGCDGAAADDDDDDDEGSGEDDNDDSDDDDDCQMIGFKPSPYYSSHRVNRMAEAHKSFNPSDYDGSGWSSEDSGDDSSDCEVVTGSQTEIRRQWEEAARQRLGSKSRQKQQEDVQSADNEKKVMGQGIPLASSCPEDVTVMNEFQKKEGQQAYEKDANHLAASITVRQSSESNEESLPLVGGREDLKCTSEFLKANEQEWIERQRELQRQALEAQKLRKRKRAEAEKRIEMEVRQKQRVEEIRATQHKEEMNMGLKDQLRGKVRAHLDHIAGESSDMASLLRRLGVAVEGGRFPSTQQVNAAYKQALLRFHPDRASTNGDVRCQVEAEEKFKLISRMKNVLSPVVTSCSASPYPGSFFF